LYTGNRHRTRAFGLSATLGTPWSWPRAELRLRWADALNVLSRVARAAGDIKAAAQAARDAYRQAWCDGPPFSYAVGLDEARTNLSAVGAPEPDGLDSFELGGPFPKMLIKPTPALRVDLSAAHRLIVPVSISAARSPLEASR
jgi:hypothetical protein